MVSTKKKLKANAFVEIQKTVEAPSAAVVVELPKPTMLLLNVTQINGNTFVEVQNGVTAYRSRALNPQEVDFFAKDVVLAMLAGAVLDTPFLNKAIPEPTELKEPLTNGIGLSMNHKQVLLVKDGNVTVVEEGVRYMMADILKTRVGHAIKNQTHFKGIF